MNDISAIEPTPTQFDKSIFTILGGTTIPDRAAIVRAECREGSRVELRRQEDGEADGTCTDVWLECRSLLVLVKAWKKIGHVPDQTAAAILLISEPKSTLVAYGTVEQSIRRQAETKRQSWLRSMLQSASSRIDDPT